MELNLNTYTDFKETSDLKEVKSLQSKGYDVVKMYTKSADAGNSREDLIMIYCLAIPKELLASKNNPSLKPIVFED